MRARRGTSPLLVARLSILFLSLSLLHVALAAPASAPFIARNISVDSASPLLRYSPPVCGTDFTLDDPLALDPGSCSGTWVSVHNPNYSEGSTTTATYISPVFNNTSPSVSFTFAGTAVYWYTTSYPSGRGARAAVKIDDALPVLIDTSSLLPGDLIVYNVVGFGVSDLDPNVAHTINVTLVPQPETLPDSPVLHLDVDAFAYTEVPDGPISSSTFSNTPSGSTAMSASTSPTSTTGAGNSKAKFTGALIALSVCGSLLVATVVGTSVMFYYRRKRRRERLGVEAQQPAPRQRRTATGHGRGPSLVGPLMHERDRDRVSAAPSGGYVYG
ncbi:hypothetical protein EXIGLDRAFT_732377 [Exidia glandulosa HHB12029]|uniref:Mid2 domain-containing protein n=1 Tax=Exidia glandulosa HHB12029 TaxID=1314781 RepID=A0A165KSL9_EXIGL|nr:hypothetical protein EXIGLDRAFT_732377 [Exidia glandulosa HHB12029]